MSCQCMTSPVSAKAAWKALSMFGGTPVELTDVQFEANPGAGTMPAGLLENELRMVSKIDPDSHIKRLRTDCLGCSAIRR